jgi:hypothetical protein
MLTREQILSAVVPAPRAVPVPVWGGDVAVRLLTVDEMLRWSAAGREGPSAGSAMMVRLAAVDAAGDLLFSDADLPWLAVQPAAALQPIVSAALSHNGMDRAGQEAAAGN